MYVAREYGENEIMGDAPQSIERRLILPNLEGMSFGDLRYIADSIDEYSREVQAMLEQKREERIAELKARMAEDQAALAELQPQPAKMVNPSKPHVLNGLRSSPLTGQSNNSQPMSSMPISARCRTWSNPT